MNGGRQGLSIRFEYEQIIVSLWEKESELASFRFDPHTFEETYRSAGGLLDNLSTEHFNPAVQVPRPFKAKMRDE